MSNIFLADLLRVMRLGADIQSKLRIATMYAHRRRRHLLRAVLKRMAPYGTGLLDLRIVVNQRLLAVRVDPRSGDRPSFFEVLDELPVEAFQQASPPELILDAGANIGLFSLRARAHYPETPILAFEPLPRNFERLAYHNGVNRANISMHQAAVWNETRETYFDVRATNTGQLSGTTQTASKDQTSQILVNCVRLPEVAPDLSTKRLLLKMDIEGAEIPVLKDLLPLISRPSVLLCELHDSPQTYPEFTLLLKRNGWRLRITKDQAGCSYWYCTLKQPAG